MSICPEEFKKVLVDFIIDLKKTFPEYEMIINKYFYNDVKVGNIGNINETISDEIYDKTFIFCKKKYSPRFFDILYQNTAIFEEDSVEDTEFIPNIYFKNIWSCDISDKTRETMWKYLQLILFSVVGKVDDKDQFGDASKLFEAINNDDFKSKLESTFEGIKNMYSKDEEEKENGNTYDIPDSEKMHEHISGLLKGKLGNLATEIAEDIAEDLNINLDDTENVNDLFSNMIKNPEKLMGLVNKVTSKLEGKIKTGDIKESELLSEASEMMQQMKDMPGMGNMQSLFSKMGMGMDMFGGGKVDTKATEQQLKRRMKLAKTKERIKAKAEANDNAKQLNVILQQQKQQKQEEQFKKESITDEELVNMFHEKPTPVKKEKRKKKKRKEE
jgi:hypothetical protein